LKNTISNFEKYNAAQFVGRGWDWVDPYKDQLANTEGLGNRTTTRTAIAAEQGNDFEDILAELAREKDLAAQYGIELEQLPTVTPAVASVED
jgi:capsid protein